jgi:hypothetical protein
MLLLVFQDFSKETSMHSGSRIKAFGFCKGFRTDLSDDIGCWILAVDFL